MSNEFNLMLSEDLAEVSEPIMRQLIESGNFNYGREHGPIRKES